MSQHTFASQVEAQRVMSAWNVDALDFRVYRVKDPLEFFKHIEDPHQFGGRAPPRHAISPRSSASTSGSAACARDIRRRHPRSIHRIRQRALRSLARESRPT